ncbi:YafY family transcriptional regulator [Sinorhizobium numidicum]|uniref:YafY family transcriptional regulator n=1 Tax=Sinorhizobium numidicum TaxID=680248 RepID=A0ABY8CYR2_9HYPH|nr:YafY family protein [Sinorhizobium numidicum]WEX76596.1 YafY family transcriptional regulator [Sinorhizobium numidicum]WEX83257.1 YafY family transcriptional regulator [Sinorhizobium numidicum]
MRPADRLFRIIQLMRATGRAMTAREIADRMEVAPRTIYRDMEHLMASGAPIDGERGVGYLLREAFDAPPLTFTFEQLEALAFGVRAVQMLGDRRLAQAAREAMEKIEYGLPADHAKKLKGAPLRAFRSALQPDPPALLGDIRQAIAEERKLRITYESLAEQTSERTIWPLGLSVFGHYWLLTAWCELRQDFRDFRVDRIISLKKGRERYEPTPERSFDAYLARME